jgi:4-amino-4-deoxy-L-arabinose transferase-like glycosyltransferase
MANKRNEIYYFFLILGIASVLFALNRRDYAIDDAWITYRYAENLAEGKGFVYNSGERVLGTSTPLYTLILAAIRFLGGPIPFTSQAIGFLSMIGALAALFLLGRILDSSKTGLLSAFFLTLLPEFHAVATYGMETPLYVLCITLTFYCYAKKQLIWTTILAAFCFLIRLDGLAVGCSIFLVHLISDRKLPWKHLLLFVAITFPWLMFSEVYFGNIFPNSFLAKRLHASPHVRLWIMEWLISQFLLVMGVLGVIVSVLKKQRTVFAIIVWSISYVIAFLFSELYGHTWYRSPLCIPLALFAGIGVRYAAGTLAVSSRGRKIASILMITVIVMPDLYSAGMEFRAGTYGDIPVEKTRYEAVQWMKQYVEPDAVIASSGIGMVGYVTKNYILDTAGLVSPQVVNKNGASEFFRYGITEYSPAYVFQAFTRPPAFMRKDYRIIQTWKTGDRIFPQFVLLKRVVPAE